MRSILIKSLVAVVIGLSAQGCETLRNLDLSSDSKPDEHAGWSAEQFQSEAKKSMDSGNYQKAIELYEKLEARYPFGEHAAQTQLDIAYAYYKNGDWDAAIASADRFIKINPRNPSVDYAYYLKGLVNFNRGIGFIDRYLPTDKSQRDPGSAREAYALFEELLRRFPDSKYVPDAKQRMVALKNDLAMYEVHVARFYMKRRAYIAAANRAGTVVEKYQRTPAVPHALLIMREAYTKLGLTDLAGDAARVYAQNYPEGSVPAEEFREPTFAEEVWEFIGLEE
ncbi:MAG: outer membrane protein assembly factor BamD [Gammaproteobacteria bacterium]